VLEDDDSPRQAAQQPVRCHPLVVAIDRSILHCSPPAPWASDPLLKQFQLVWFKLWFIFRLRTSCWK
jgi:hypothetical protein